MMKPLLAGSLAFGLAVAGCGGDDKKTATPAPPPSPAPQSPAPTSAAPTTPAPVGALVALGKTKEGMALVDGQGKALYLFEKDKQKNVSTCLDACAKAWPPYVTTGKPEAINGAKTDLLGTFKRADGTMQISYAGHPLYYFVKDKAPGDSFGQDVEGFGAEWYLLDAGGKIIH